MYESLLKPGKIGTLELKNRLVMTPANLSYASPEGYVTPQIIEFYRRRAQGGVGLITVGAAGVDPTRINTAGVMTLSKDCYIDGMKELADAIHAAGAKTVVQLWHPGAYAIPAQHSGQLPAAPSKYFCGFSHSETHELSIQEIEEIENYFVQAAIRAKAAGYDGVELVGSAGYLISQFLSSATNHRTDKYGGDLQARMTFLIELYKKMRMVVGPDYPIIVRLAGNEFVKGGNNNDDCVEIAKVLDNLGVDALNITGGWHETGIPQVTMDVPHGAYSYLAKRVKNAVSIPVYACNRMDVKTAAAVLDRGDADFIGICRGLIADPDLANKLAAGKPELIRPCVGCNQGCLDHIFKGIPLGCLSNPDAGFEAKDKAAEAATATSESATDKLLIIGAGVSGMEYALRSAYAGSKVTVWETSESYGGQINLAAAPAGRESFLELIDYQYNSCLDAGVKFCFGKKATAEEIENTIIANEFDKVVIATGAKAEKLEYKTEDGANVLSAWDVLGENSDKPMDENADKPVGKNVDKRGDKNAEQNINSNKKTSLGKNIVIIGGGATAVEAALKLATIGTIDAETLKFLFLNHAESPEMLYELLTKGSYNISIVSRQPKLGRGIGASTKWIKLGDLRRYHVSQYTETKLLEIKKGSVLLEKADGTQFTLAADTVVMASGARSENALAKALAEKLLGKVISIGDAVKPGKAYDAMKDAREAVLKE